MLLVFTVLIAAAPTCWDGSFESVIQRAADSGDAPGVYYREVVLEQAEPPPDHDPWGYLRRPRWWNDSDLYARFEQEAARHRSRSDFVGEFRVERFRIGLGYVPYTAVWGLITEEKLFVLWTTERGKLRFASFVGDPQDDDRDEPADYRSEDWDDVRRLLAESGGGFGSVVSLGSSNPTTAYVSIDLEGVCGQFLVHPFGADRKSFGHASDLKGLDLLREIAILIPDEVEW